MHRPPHVGTRTRVTVVNKRVTRVDLKTVGGGASEAAGRICANDERNPIIKFKINKK